MGLPVLKSLSRPFVLLDLVTTSSSSKNKSKMNDEAACTFAASILNDDGIQITADKIEAILKAANVRVKPFWPSLFTRVLANRNIEELVISSGGGAAAPAAAPAGGAPVAAAADAAPAAAKETKKEEKKEESEEDDDM